jgi:hypothetical protein
MIAAALRRIEAELRALIARAEEEHAIDAFALGVIARRINAQAESLELGLDE